MSKRNKIRGGEPFRLIGQAGVWAVASQLALRGHNCLFPAVDNGYDLMLANGLKIQVKTRYLTDRDYKAYPHGMYCFDLRRPIWDKTEGRVSPTNYRSYKDVCDFFVLWGVDENRFWIIPSSIEQGTVSFGSTASNVSRGPLVSRCDGKAKRLALSENRWDLLDVNATVELVGVTLPGPGQYPVEIDVKEKL